LPHLSDFANSPTRQGSAIRFLFAGQTKHAMDSWHGSHTGIVTHPNATAPAMPAAGDR